MLRVTIELVPHGMEDRKKKIGEMVIANDGSGDSFNGNYQALIAEDSWSGDKEAYVKVHGYDRSQSVWELVETVLRLRYLKFDHVKDESFFKRLKKRLGYES